MEGESGVKPGSLAPQGDSPKLKYPLNFLIAMPRVCDLLISHLQPSYKLQGGDSFCFKLEASADISEGTMVASSRPDGRVLDGLAEAG